LDAHQWDIALRRRIVDHPDEFPAGMLKPLLSFLTTLYAIVEDHLDPVFPQLPCDNRRLFQRLSPNTLRKDGIPDHTPHRKPASYHPRSLPCPDLYQCGEPHTAEQEFRLPQLFVRLIFKCIRGVFKRNRFRGVAHTDSYNLAAKLGITAGNCFIFTLKPTAHE